jgi:hypothetical protein
MSLNPNKGFGRPGSLRWHELHVEQCVSVEELSDYLKAVTGKGFSLEKLKAVALSGIKEFLDDKSK